jgi:RimJ/RimL family protein N-acetyltransferase
MTAALSLRPVVETDSALLFEWANDRVVRASSFSPDPIPWDVHRDWFARVLRDRDRVLYLILGPDREPMGQARFDRCGDRQAEISISLAAKWRGRHLAAPAIRLATSRAITDRGLETVHAYVRPENEVSRRAFVRAGYAELGPAMHKGCEALHLRDVASKMSLAGGADV